MVESAHQAFDVDERILLGVLPEFQQLKVAVSACVCASAERDHLNRPPVQSCPSQDPVQLNAHDGGAAHLPTEDCLIYQCPVPERALVFEAPLPHQPSLDALAQDT